MEKNWFRRIMNRKATTKQCDIHVVVKSFYCDNRHNNIPNMNCEKQCWFCKEQKLDKQ